MDEENDVSEYFNDEALEWMQKIMSQQRICDSENSALRHIYKLAKQAGHNTKSMRKAIKNGKGDPAEVIKDLRDEIHYSGLRHVPVTPESLFDGMDFAVTEKTQMSQDVWDCEENAYMAGRHGAKLDDNPYNPGEEMHVHWTLWFQKGEQSLARELGPDGAVAPATRRRPRRRQEPLPIKVDPPLRHARAVRRARRRNGPEVAADGEAIY